MTDAEITEWMVADGERVAEGQEILRLCTDGASVDRSSDVTGHVVSVDGGYMLVQ